MVLPVFLSMTTLQKASVPPIRGIGAGYFRRDTLAPGVDARWINLDQSGQRR
jgi:hypothetical protein